jgi:hypothetical protein
MSPCGQINGPFYMGKLAKGLVLAGRPWDAMQD